MNVVSFSSKSSVTDEMTITVYNNEDQELFRLIFNETLSSFNNRIRFVKVTYIHKTKLLIQTKYCQDNVIST
jgi:hypothetical protein